MNVRKLSTWNKVNIVVGIAIVIVVVMVTLPLAIDAVHTIFGTNVGVKP